MKRVYSLFVFCVCLQVCAAFANDGLHGHPGNDERLHPNEAVAGIDEPLFDFPISRALGINVQEWLAPRIPRPGIYDLAPTVNS